MLMEYASKLQEARCARRWTVTYVADQIGVQRSTVSRWENGQETPRPVHIAALEKLYGMSAQELGLEEALVPHQRLGPRWSEAMEMRVSQALLSRVYAAIVVAGVTPGELARLRMMIVQELEGPDMKDGFSRRETVQLLATMPVVLFNLSSSQAIDLLKSPIEELLKQCTAGIVACEQLAKGDAADLRLASLTLSHYLPTLRTIVKQDGRYRKQAASLVAQASMRKALLVMHHAGGKASIEYAKQAVLYGKDSGDVSLYISALVRLAYCYGSNKQYAQAQETAELAAACIESARVPLSPLLISGLYASSARYSSLLAKKDDVPQLLARAHESFERQGEDDEHAYIDMSGDIFALSEGQSHYFSGQPHLALDSLGKIISLESGDFALKMSVSSPRILTELFNYAALSSLKLPHYKKDKKRSLALTSRGLDGAETLASRPRYDESDRAIDIMESLWPDDRDVIALRERAIAIKAKLWGNGKKKTEE